MELYIFALFRYAAVMSYTKLPRRYADVILSYTRLQFYTTVLLLPITYLHYLKERFSISAASLGLPIIQKLHSVHGGEWHYYMRGEILPLTLHWHSTWTAEKMERCNYFPKQTLNYCVEDTRLFQAVLEVIRTLSKCSTSLKHLRTLLHEGFWGHTVSLKGQEIFVCLLCSGGWCLRWGVMN